MAFILFSYNKCNYWYITDDRKLTLEDIWQMEYLESRAFAGWRIGCNQSKLAYRWSVWLSLWLSVWQLYLWCASVQETARKK